VWKFGGYIGLVKTSLFSKWSHARVQCGRHQGMESSI
jgi:hypothetical protein